MKEQDLTLVGLTEDKQKLVLVNQAGEEFTLPADARLRAALRGEHARLGQVEITMESALRPRDIQARIRAGESPEAVAAAAQTSIEKIMGYATPVLAERQLLVGADRREPAGTGRGARLRAAGRGLLADQPAGLVVLGHDVATGGVEHELGVPVALAGAVVGDQRPAAVLPAPGVPLHARGVDVAGAEALRDHVAEQPGRAFARLAAHRRALRPVGDVCALRQHRGGVAHDLVDRGLRGGRDALG
jgi:hypothetical protein